MAPLTRPDLINPLVRSFLQSQLGHDRVPLMHGENDSFDNTLGT